MSRYSVLVVDTEMLNRDLLVSHLRHAGFHVEAASGVPDAEKILAGGKGFPIALVSLALGEKAANRLTGMVKESASEAVVFLLGTSPGSQDAAIVARLGAWDMIVKPLRLEDLKIRLAQAVEVFELRSRAAVSRASRAAGGNRRLRPLDEEIHIPELSEIVSDEDGREQKRSGAAGSGGDAVRDIPGSVVEEAYRRRQRAEYFGGDAIEQIRRIGELCKSGILTEKEFNDKKKELLSRI